MNDLTREQRAQEINSVLRTSAQLSDIARTLPEHERAIVERGAAMLAFYCGQAFGTDPLPARPAMDWASP